MSRNNYGGQAQGAHKSAAIVVHLLARATGPNDRHIRPQSGNLTFDVIHPAEQDNLVTAKTNQICESSSLRVNLLQREGCLHSSRSNRRTEVVLVVQGAVNARNDFERERTEFVVLSAMDGDQLLFGDAVGAHHILRALGANYCCSRFESDVRNI